MTLKQLRRGLDVETLRDLSGIDASSISSLQTEENAGSLQYDDLSDGKFIGDIIQRLYPCPDYEDVAVAPQGSQWKILIRRLQECFRSATGEHLSDKFLPDVEKLTGSPNSRESHTEIENVLRLLLVCAVKCPDNESYLENIRLLEEHVQLDIMHNIKEILDHHSSANDMFYQSLSDSLRLPPGSLRTEVPLEVPQYSTYLSGGDPEMFPSLDASHKNLVTELTDCKSSLRQLQQEITVKNYQIQDLEEDLREAEAEVEKLKKENMRLEVEVSKVRVLRDENDILREELGQAERSLTSSRPVSDHQQEAIALKTRLKEVTTELSVMRHERDSLVDENKRNHFETHRLVQLQRKLERSKQAYKNLTEENEKNLSEMFRLRGALDQISGEQPIRYGRTGYGPISLQSGLSENETDEDIEDSQSEDAVFEERRLSEAANFSMITEEDAKQRAFHQAPPIGQASHNPDDVVNMTSLRRDLEHLKLSNESAEKQVQVLQQENSQLQNHEKILRKKVSENEREQTALYKEYGSLKNDFSNLAEEHCSAVIASLKKLVTETTINHKLLQMKLDELKPREVNLPSTPTDVHETHFDTEQLTSMVEASVTSVSDKVRTDCQTERDGMMQVFVKNLNGQTLTVEVRDTDTVESFKSKVEDRLGIPLGHQRLVMGCKQMQDGHFLYEYGAHPNVTVNILVRLSGGYLSEQEVPASKPSYNMAF